MAKTMLIDATHPEETRVAVVDGKKLEEFDVEIAGRRPLKGNIYLAKVTRVEPSLQACFVEYGGNRHGFLAFSEIHPDYYRIPVADREALMREAQDSLEGEHEADQDSEGLGERLPAEAPESRSGDSAPAARDTEQPGFEASEAGDAREPGMEPPTAAPSLGAPREADEQPHFESAMPLLAHQDVLRQEFEAQDGEAQDVEARGGGWGAPSPVVESPWPGAAGEAEAGAPEAAASGAEPDLPSPSHGELVEVAIPEEVLDTVGGSESATQDDPEVDEENARRRRQRALRRYKIQEVIKRRQILLVQVTKEERGNKGAALTTYLSLAGRYCVLMPNTDRGGGISRRITSLNDRKRLKNIVDELDVPEGMAVIVRTAGSERTKAEVKRDFEYLMRLWDEIRETTLKSSAPALIYEEASLIKRSIRDLYTRDMGDIVVAGVEGYKQARSFMCMLTPSHAKRIQLYRDTSIPLFQRYQVESQLAAIHNPVVHLRSGGYIVINQTEALVAVDVNSGRATKERNIEETAFKTNLEAAEEIARQLRLRDLAGLIVIDFIDMEEGRNNSGVERRLKDSLRNDRARIQIGRISSFGLLEMSRQRLHPSLQEASTEICPHCRGSGRIRSVDSTALHVLRMVEEEITRSFSPGVSIFAPTAVALYVLNRKRMALNQLEARRGVRIYVNGDDSLTPPDFRLERIKQLAPGEELPPAQAPVALPTDAEMDLGDDLVDEAAEETAEATGEATETAAESAAGSGDEDGGRRRRRRRRRGRGSRFSADEFTEAQEATQEGAPEGARETFQEAALESGARQAQSAEAEAAEPSVPGEAEALEETGDDTEEGMAPGAEGEPRRRRRRGRRGGRRRSRRGQEDEAASGAEGAAAERDDAALYDEPTGEGEQPAVPDDADNLPPQWRQPPAAERGPEAQAEAELESMRSVAAPEAEYVPSAAHAAASVSAAPAPAREAASSPVTVIEIGGSPDEKPAHLAAPDDSSNDQARRRGWWRRLIE